MSNLSKPNTNRIKTVLLIYKRKSLQIAEADRHILVLASHDKCCRRQLSLENTKHYQGATFLQMKYNRRTSLLVTFNFEQKTVGQFSSKKFNFFAHIIGDSRHFFLSVFDELALWVLQGLWIQPMPPRSYPRLFYFWVNPESVGAIIRLPARELPQSLYGSPPFAYKTKTLAWKLTS